jgi:hypothetical protein
VSESPKAKIRIGGGVDVVGEVDIMDMDMAPTQKLVRYNNTATSVGSHTMVDIVGARKEDEEDDRL